MSAKSEHPPATPEEIRAILQEITRKQEETARLLEEDRKRAEEDRKQAEKERKEDRRRAEEARKREEKERKESRERLEAERHKLMLAADKRMKKAEDLFTSQWASWSRVWCRANSSNCYRHGTLLLMRCKSGTMAGTTERNGNMTSWPTIARR